MDSSNSREIHHDRLSLLPDSLILEILSLLPMRDVVSTMLLSKRWLYLWTTVPCLYFQHKYNDEERYEEFVSFALLNWAGSKIHKFSFSFDSTIFNFVDAWLFFATENQVEELHVSCHDDRITEYCPPQHLYSCSSITKMSLTRCNLIIDEAVQWNRLKSLRIGSVLWFSADSVNRILAGAPLLEELILEHFYCEENLNIGSSNLKILTLGMNDTIVYKEVVRIWAPNLLDLVIYGSFYGTCLLDVPSLTKANICFRDSPFIDSQYLNYHDLSLPPDEMFHQIFQSIRRVEKLSLSKVNIKPLLCIKNGFEFPNVKSLSFYPGRAEEMLGVLDMFPNLTTLRVNNDRKGERRSHLSKADLPSPFLPFLKKVEINWDMPDVEIIPAAEILLENAKLLDKMVFKATWPYRYGDKREVLLSKSAASPTAEVTIIHR